MMEQFASRFASSGIKFFSAHPGWADTVAVRESLPDFHARMQGRLRTAAEGADTIIWLCMKPELPASLNGEFFEDRRAVTKHFTLGGTRSTPAECEAFFGGLEALAKSMALLPS
eukprot:m.199485 g.199485  ORF g.199485 m.199485 type:complete len:114 (+) comp53804_c0_seq44:891-1232(+)